MSRLRIILASALCASLVWAGMMAARQSSPSRPNAVFTTLKGEPVELAAMKGRPVLVTFWASNCANCLKEMPHLVELYEDYHVRGLEIIAVAMQYDMPSQVVALVSQRGLPYPVVLDTEGTHASAFGGVTGVPASFLISPKGDIALRASGVLDMKALRTLIHSMLAET